MKLRLKNNEWLVDIHRHSMKYDEEKKYGELKWNNGRLNSNTETRSVNRSRTYLLLIQYTLPLYASLLMFAHLLCLRILDSDELKIFFFHTKCFY